MRFGATAVIVMVACAGSGAATVNRELHVRVRTDSEAPVPDAIVMLDATTRGVTDAGGSLRTMVSGAPGQRARIDVACPTGFRTRADGIDVVLRRADGDLDTPAAMTLDVQCLPIMRRGVLVVRAPGGTSLPILINGERTGEVGVAGLAHVPLSLLPGTNLRVMLDTSAAPKLRPANPTQQFSIDDRDAVLAFDQAFVSVTPKRRPRRPSHIPYRIN